MSGTSTVNYNKYCVIPRKVVKGHDRSRSRCLHTRHRVPVRIGWLRLTFIVLFANTAVKTGDGFPRDGQIVWEAFRVHDVGNCKML